MSLDIKTVQATTSFIQMDFGEEGEMEPQHCQLLCMCPPNHIQAEAIWALEASIIHWKPEISFASCKEIAMEMSGLP